MVPGGGRKLYYRKDGDEEWNVRAQTPLRATRDDRCKEPTERSGEHGFTKENGGIIPAFSGPRHLIVSQARPMNLRRLACSQEMI